MSIFLNLLFSSPMKITGQLSDNGIGSSEDKVLMIG